MYRSCVACSASSCRRRLSRCTPGSLPAAAAAAALLAAAAARAGGRRRGATATARGAARARPPSSPPPPPRRAEGGRSDGGGGVVGGSAAAAGVGESLASAAVTPVVELGAAVGGRPRCRASAAACAAPNARGWPRAAGSRARRSPARARAANCCASRRGGADAGGEQLLVVEEVGERLDLPAVLAEAPTAGERRTLRGHRRARTTSGRGRRGMWRHTAVPSPGQ